MTKKDYELITRAIKKTRFLLNGLDIPRKDIAIASIDQLTLTLSEALKTENTRFDIKRFLEACNE